MGLKMNDKDFYIKVGLKGNPFPMSGVTPADDPGELKYIEPIGMENIIQIILNDFDKHLQNTQSGGFALIGKYGQGKSLLLHYLLKAFRERRNNLEDLKDKVVISFVKGRDLEEPIDKNIIPGEILSVIIESLRDEKVELSNDIKEEFYSIQKTSFTEKKKDFNRIMSSYEIRRIFIFVDEVEDLSKFSRVIQTYRDLVDDIPRISVYLFCTDDAWSSILSTSLAIIQEGTGIGRIKEFDLPPFDYDIAIKFVNKVMNNAKTKDSKLENPFSDGLIRNICLCSQFDGRVFCIICNTLLYRFVKEKNSSKIRSNFIKPDELLNNEVLNTIKINEKDSPVFDFELYNTMINSFSKEFQKDLFNLFLAYYKCFSREEIQGILDVEYDDYFEFVYLTTDIIKPGTQIINKVSEIDFKNIETNELFDKALERGWYNYRIRKETKSGSVSSFLSLSIDDMKKIFNVGGGNYYIPLNNFDDISYLINTSKIKNFQLFDTKNSKALIEFLKQKGCITEKKLYRMSEFLIYNIFKRDTPIGFNPWDSIPDVINREKVKEWYKKNRGNELFLGSSFEGLYQIFESLNKISENIRIKEMKSENIIKINNYYFLEIHFSDDYIHNTKFLISYIANNKDVVSDLYNYYKDTFKVPNGILLFIDEEQQNINKINELLEGKILKDNIELKDKIDLIPIGKNKNVSLFLLGLSKLKENHSIITGKPIDFTFTEKIISDLSRTIRMKLSTQIRTWISIQEKNGTYLKKFEIEPIQFISGLLKSLEMLQMITIDKKIINVNVLEEIEYFRPSKNELFDAIDFYKKNTSYVDGTITITNLSLIARMGLTKKNGYNFSILISPFEKYIINLLIKTKNIKFSELIERLNFEGHDKEKILKLYVSVLAHKGIIQVLSPTELIDFRLSYFITNEFELIKLRDIESALILRIESLAKKELNINTIKSSKCSHGVEVVQYMKESKSDINRINSRYTFLKNRFIDFFNKIFNSEILNLNQDKLITGILTKELKLSKYNVDAYLMNFPVLNGCLFFMENAFSNLETIYSNSYDKCQSIHKKLGEIEEKLNTLKNIFDQTESAITELNDKVSKNKKEK